MFFPAVSGIMTSLNVLIDIRPVISFRIASFISAELTRGSPLPITSVHLMFFVPSFDAFTEFKNVAGADKRDDFT
jgi:hypothetical protein